MYLKLGERGYEVVSVHPEAGAFYGDTCSPNLSAMPGGVDAVFIMNSPDVTEKVTAEAIGLGIKRVWMHNNTLMGSSASKTAVEHCR